MGEGYCKNFIFRNCWKVDFYEISEAKICSLVRIYLLNLGRTKTVFRALKNSKIGLKSKVIRNLKIHFFVAKTWYSYYGLEIIKAFKQQVRCNQKGL